MESLIRKLQPISIWNHFSDLNAVPRPSKKEERIIEFMVNFGKKLMLETIVDGVGNVIIKKNNVRYDITLFSKARKNERGFTFLG